jgi:hypothetical protein
MKTVDDTDIIEETGLLWKSNLQTFNMALILKHITFEAGSHVRSQTEIIHYLLGS